MNIANAIATPIIAIIYSYDIALDLYDNEIHIFMFTEYAGVYDTLCYIIYTLLYLIDKCNGKRIIRCIYIRTANVVNHQPRTGRFYFILFFFVFLFERYIERKKKL